MTTEPNSGRDSRGRFSAGNPGGPGGSRRRALELRRAAEEAITPEHVQAVVRKLTRMALEGNANAIRLFVDRFCGRLSGASVEGEPLNLDLPRLVTADDCGIALDLILQATCHGDIDRETARVLISGIQARLGAIGRIEFERRMTQVEEAAAHLECSASSTGGAEGTP